MATGGLQEIGHDLVNVGTLTHKKMHRTVLNRCRPQLLMDLDVRVVMIFIQQIELFDEVTIRDINEQTTTTDKISHLVDQIKKRDQDTYERFKECLILAKRADLKIMLEEEEEKLTAEIKEKNQVAEDSKVKSPKQAGAKKVLAEPQTKSVPFLHVTNIDGQDKDDVDAPITEEHINHARMCYASTTVYSNALRVFILTNVPMPHTDIYKAIMANKAKLKNLNKDQVQLVFPDPNGLFIGKQNIDFVDETCWSTSNQTMPEECQKQVQEKALLPQKKYHAFFSYASPDIQWVKKIVKKLETDHGFVCCEYDRDNTPGTPLLTFVDESIRNAHKTVVVMTREAFQSVFVKHEIQMAIHHGLIEKRKCIVPVLVEDCEIPGYLKVFNYIDARDKNKSSIWWPKLLMELEYEVAEDSKVKSPKQAGAKKVLAEPQTKGHYPDAPITQEHVNHARLCVAIVTVCQNAMREILSTHVPSPYTDIHQAILAKRSMLIGRHRRLLLNSGQLKLVFPDPQGTTTGKVDQFDISLLYTLIRNISLVAAPVTGWGHDPLDQPRDNSLGANVERIRSFRNLFIGHPIDVKISQQDFEHYWAKIYEVLREIEIVIGNHGYLEDLEKLKNETIILHEAHELQKKFQEYNKQTEGTGIPVEILNMDDRSIQLFENALKEGKEKVYNIRVMVVGHQGVGKTTLIKRLLGENVNMSVTDSTEGIDVHLHCCDVSLPSHEWTLRKEVSEQDYRLQRLAKVIIKKQVRSEAADAKPQEGDITDISAQELVAEEPNLVSHPVVLKNHPKSNANNVVRSEPKANVSSESGMKDPDREMLQLLQKNADKIKHDLGKYAPLTIYDFAGQYAFYTTHQMFLSRRAIYLLVSNISKHLDDKVDGEFYVDKKGKMECRVRELLDIWMNSIHSCAPSDEEIMKTTSDSAIPPPVILVGTHADAIPQDNRHDICENYFSEIRSFLEDKPSMFHLVDEDFAIDNTVVDSKLEGLKRKIVEVASRQPYWEEEIPARWLSLEQVLMNLRAQGYKVIDRGLLENINQAGVQISKDELDLFLRFQHEIGTILYFSTELLKEKIVLEPQWMIKALKSLITTKKLYFQRHAKSVTSKWNEFYNDGKLTPELIDALWTKDSNPDLHDNKDHILLLMEQLNIIAKPKFYVDDGSEIKEVNYFFAPCMLQEKPPREVIFPEPDEEMESSSVMCYAFTEKFLPAPIFHRLLAACVAQWPLATKNMGKTLKNQIFCSCGVFRIDRLHKLTLYCSGYIIFMRVTRQGTKDKTPSSKLCIEVKEFIAKVLNKVIGYLGHSLKFEESIQCPEYNGEIVDCRIPVKLLKENDEVICDSHEKLIESKKILKFWIDVENKNIDCQDADDVDAPFTQEHINFFRLLNALKTVCSNALREILLTNVPTPHTDIYKAILAKRNKLKLNKEQIQLVYPDPLGHSTGKVEDFDISLLCKIIKVVSSVPAPKNGWGQPLDNPRDKTLGASVERIRLSRNTIVGHDVHGKISQQEFEDYWAKIDDVLREIESVIGNHGYLHDLEKHKNQPITQHEARELYKDFLELKRKIKAKASGMQKKLEDVLSDVKELLTDQN